MGRKVHLLEFPQRIVSLVPSQTELLYELGLDERVVGITKFCVHPNDWFRSKVKIGGTKKLNFKVIEALNPDLIIGNKEENEEAQIKSLITKFPVWMSNISNLTEACEMIQTVGGISGFSEKSKQLTSNIQRSFSQLKNQLSKKVLYLIWNKPYMAAGKQTFIDDMLSKCGLINCLNANRYPELSNQAIMELNPELVFLSSEPYPFKEMHIKELQSILPNAKIALVDGEMFSWYGSRLLAAPDYFQSLLADI